MLEVKNLGVRFGTLDIVKGASFSVQPGQWLMLVGPNGAGKSTLLSALAGLLPYGGAVNVGGIDLQRLKPRERATRMGLLRQDNPLSYAFTVEEIVRLGRYAKTSWLQKEERTAAPDVDEALKAVDLTAQRSQSALTLSGGELQRAFIAQLLVQDPPLLLLDEPTSHLDLRFQTELLDLLVVWLRQGQRGIVSVVHDLSLARLYGTHALLLNQGETVAVGPLDEVLTDTNLNRVYGMDVRTFMGSLYGQWRKPVQGDETQ